MCLYAEPGFRILKPINVDGSQKKSLEGPNYSPSLNTSNRLIYRGTPPSATYFAPGGSSSSQLNRSFDSSFNRSSPNILTGSPLLNPRHGSPLSSRFSPTCGGYSPYGGTGRISPSSIPRLDTSLGSHNSSLVTS